LLDLVKKIVEAGYDAIARTYLTWSAQIADDPRLHYLDEFDSRLDTGAKVLELGCGAGIPVTRKLAERHDVLGIDLSQQQIDLAQTNVPTARFEKADMTALDFPDGTFDGIAAFYSILHVPRAEQPALLAKIARWLKPGGLFLASLGTGTRTSPKPGSASRCSSAATRPPRTVSSSPSAWRSSSTTS
jgi:ubiquinone/menaquinone biosynthesis C-methylase UbiE